MTDSFLQEQKRTKEGVRHVRADTDFIGVACLRESQERQIIAYLRSNSMSQQSPDREVSINIILLCSSLETSSLSKASAELA